MNDALIAHTAIQEVMVEKAERIVQSEAKGW